MTPATVPESVVQRERAGRIPDQLHEGIVGRPPLAEMLGRSSTRVMTAVT